MNDDVAFDRYLMFDRFKPEEILLLRKIVSADRRCPGYANQTCGHLFFLHTYRNGCAIDGCYCEAD